MNLKHTALFFVLFIPVISLAQIPVPTDKTQADSLKDSTIVADTINPATLGPGELSAPERRLADIQNRMKEFKESEKPLPRFSFYDSLVTYFTSERFNMRAQLDRSYYHDAGDYFRFDPNFVVLDYQTTPMRKSVQPFGLTGDRLNVILNGIPFTPFEHVVEPDGMIDMNDIPTALDGAVYIIPGPAGQLFGGSGIATLLSVPAAASNNAPASAFMADKGYFGYAFVRGRFNREFSGGREISLTAESRKSDGLEIGRSDEQLHYSTAMHYPIGKNFGFNIDGKLYDRDAALAIRPDSGGALLSRHRFDRGLRTGVEFHNAPHTSRIEFGYRHLRQGSYLNDIYKGRFNNTVNGVFAAHERMLGSRTFKAEAAADFTDYDNGKEFHRFNSSIALSLASLKKVHNLGIQLKTIYSDEFDFLPSASMLYQSDWEKLFVQLSVGIAQSEPLMNQLYLPSQQKAIYGTNNLEYSESGNPNLKKESQLVGNFTIVPGTVENNVTFNVTGGKITDAIEWSSNLSGGVVSVRHFTLVNDDITFVTASARPTFRISDFLHFNSGAAWHKYDYDSLGDRPYQPEYNFLAGLELHHYWKDRLIHLNAYGEIVYTGPYDGYDKQGLGKELIANAKLSLGLKNFRFHFVFQNAFDNVYEARESMTIPGRFFYYGLTWNFFD